MPTTTIDSHEIHVDDEGFMTQYDEWTEDLGTALAAQIGVEMSRGALEGHPLPAQRLPRARRDRDAAPGGDGRWHPDQAAVHALSQEAGQEDGLHRRAAEASRLRVNRTGDHHDHHRDRPDRPVLR